MTPEFRRVGITAAALLATLAASKAIDRRRPDALERPLESIPLEIAGWRGADDPPIRGDILSALDATSYLSRTYRKGNKTVNLFIAYYANQRAGESMHSPKHCLPGSGWDFLSYGKTDLASGGGHVRVNRDIVQKASERVAIIYWYQSRRRVIADEFRAKLYLIRDNIVDGRSGGAIVRLTYPADRGQDGGGEELAAAVFPAVRNAIGWVEAGSATSKTNE